jgi:hypothetical protein
MGQWSWARGGQGWHDVAGRRWRATAASSSARKETAITEDRYKLGSLGDLIELLVDGWQVEHLHYADSCGTGSEEGRPGAFIELKRPDQGRYGIYIADDGRAFSHRALISLFRERPHIWKHRTADRIHQLAADQPMADPREPEEWGAVPEPFPQGLVFSPGTLRGVVSVNRTESIDDVTVTLTVLERYQNGARLRYLAHTADAKRRKQIGGGPDVLVVDDLGRRYRTAPLECRRDGNRAEGVVAVAPAIPREVNALTITVGSIGDGRDAIPGPWVFPVQLGDTAVAE